MRKQEDQVEALCMIITGHALRPMEYSLACDKSVLPEMLEIIMEMCSAASVRGGPVARLPGPPFGQRLLSRDWDPSEKTVMVGPT